ncbi:MAG: DUF4199 domain-containing protein [Alphaproteobacteria bacterium]
MLRKILIYGTIAGLIVGGWLFGVTVTVGPHVFGAWSAPVGYLSMLIALSTVFVAVKRHRDIAQGGVIKFWPALGMGLGISLIAGIFYVVAWEAAVAVTHIDFGTVYADAVIEQARAKGTTGPALDKLIDEMEAFKQQYANPLYRLPMTFAEIFPVGVLVSLVSAALLRNPRFLAARG